jgi:hypothetical protein
VDPSLPLIVETDACDKAIGAALIQEVKTEEVIERRLIYTPPLESSSLPRQDTQPSGENSWVSLSHSRISGRF